jgi:Holliday junction resolvase
MTGRSSRTKGAAAEREFAKMLADELGVDVKRNLGQARDGGDDITVGRYRLEVKRREALRMDEWCKQIETAAGPGEVPVVVYRRNGQPWRAVVPIALLINAMREDMDG